jgi:acetolactate synthase I/III small subunit
MLIKVRAPPGAERSEINDLVRIFRGRIVDVGEATFTIAVTGDPGKVRKLFLKIIFFSSPPLSKFFFH